MSTIICEQTAKDSKSKQTEKETVELADIFRSLGQAYLKEARLSARQERAFRNIVACRTAAKGGHVWRCNACGHEVNEYNSCLDRHCPKCQGKARFQWVAKKMQDLLNTPYFHGVFTLPHELNPLVCYNTSLLDLLFQAVSQTLLLFGRDPQHLGGQLGLLAILHTWDQKLNRHYHLHCIIPGGALTVDGQQWIPSKTPSFLFPVKPLSQTFRRLFWHGSKTLPGDSTEQAGKLRTISRKFKGFEDLFKEGALDLPPRFEKFHDPEVFNKLKNQLYQKDWVVYMKKPFANPDRVLKSLGHYAYPNAISNPRILNHIPAAPSAGRKNPKSFIRPQQEFVGQTHLLEYLGENVQRVAISDKRILSHANGMVTFSWKDRKNDYQRRTLSLPARNFANRFLQHVLPKGFMKIRAYGLLASRNKKAQLQRCRQLLGEVVVDPSLLEIFSRDDEEETQLQSKKICPLCKKLSLMYLRPISRFCQNPGRKAIWDSS